MSELKVQLPDGCGNSPRAQLMCDFVVAISKQDQDFVASWTDDNTTWRHVGSTQASAVDLLAQLDVVFPAPVLRLEVSTALSHGKFGSVNGTFAFEDHSQWEFCDVYEFAGHNKTAKVRSITSYWINT